MTRDIETLTNILLVVLWIAAIFVTAFPILYGMTRWWEYLLGRILMLTMVSLLLAVDMTLLLHYWQPKDILWYFWVQFIVFSLIAVSSAAMCYKVIQLNYRTRKRR